MVEWHSERQSTGRSSYSNIINITGNIFVWKLISDQTTSTGKITIVFSRDFPLYLPLIGFYEKNEYLTTFDYCCFENKMASV